MRDQRRSLAAHVQRVFSEVQLPGAVTQRVRSTMRLEATLADRWSVVIACDTVKSRMFWMLSLSDGPVMDVMEALELQHAPGFSGRTLFRGTSHNLMPERSHHAFSAETDLEAVAKALQEDVSATALPIVHAFCVEPRLAVTFILNGGAGHVRNPFTTCLILLGLANDLATIDEVLAVARNDERFYDLHRAVDPEQIVRPVVDGFTSPRTHLGCTASPAPRLTLG